MHSFNNLQNSPGNKWCLQEPLVGLVEHLGDEGFVSRFLAWLHADMGVDQCMLFFCDANHAVSTLLYKDFRGDTSARALAQAYTDGRHYRQDPNYECLSDCADDELYVFHLDHLISGMKSSYRHHFFEAPGFRDKVSIIRGHASGNYYLNLYRRQGDFRSVFGQAGDEDSASRFMSSLIVKHYQLNKGRLSQSPLAFLSSREQQVCQAILQGKKGEQIARELEVSVNSVITYRKRAYEKLGISRRGQLFALCQ